MKDMAEVIIDTNNQCKRRLPKWVQSNNMSKNVKFDILDEKYSMSGKQKELDVVPRIESISSETDLVLVKKKNDPDDKRNYSKKKARKLKKHVSSIDSTCSSSRSKEKLEDDIMAGNKHEDDIMEGNEVELTVEDLISIAEEFLSADKVIQQEQSVTRESNYIPTSSSVNLEGNLNGGLTKCNQTTRSHPNTLEHNQPDESSSFSSNKITQSGDAAKDMLELFLGPLLKDAPPRKSDPEITRELPTSTYEADNRVKSSFNDEELEPLRKKKSSLKDKVAMFF